MLWPCHWDFVENLRIVLAAIGGDLHPAQPFAACGRNMARTPLRPRMKVISDTLRTFRGEDVACRYGGDEFTIILPEASICEVWQRAEQLREAFKEIEYKHEGKNYGPLTLSIGISAYPDHGASVEQLLKASDTAAYTAKVQGRDRVMIGGGEE